MTGRRTGAGALEATVAEVEVALAAAVHAHPLLHRTTTLVAGKTGVRSDEVGQRMTHRTLLLGSIYEPLGLSPFCKSSQAQPTHTSDETGADTPDRRR